MQWAGRPRRRTRQEPAIQPSDTYAQHGRKLASEVTRTRDWAGGDPARLGRVADALTALTAHRLAGHAFGEGAKDAQEAVTLASRTLAAQGPIGPYTPQPDAARSVTALVQVAVLQWAAGLLEPASQTLTAALGLRGQLSRLDLDAGLDLDTIAWGLLVWARVALAAGDVAAANARADAALAVGADTGFLPLDLDRLAGDARWAAGRPGPSVEYLLRAVERYDAEALEALRRPSTLAPALLSRLSEPLYGLYSETADRLLVIGAPGAALTLRRRLAEVLDALVQRHPALRPTLVAALTDLAHDLRSTGRPAEADDVAERAATLAGDGVRPSARQRTTLGAHASWTALPASVTFGVAGGTLAEPEGRLAALRGPADAAEQQRRLDFEAELRRRADEAAGEAERLGQQSARERAKTARLAAEQAVAERREQQRAEAAAEHERLENQRRRAERMAEHQLQLEREVAEREAALRARVADETPAEQAEREELERRAAELAREQTAAAEAGEQPDDLDPSDVHEARDASEARVNELRARYSSDPDRYAQEYLEALDELSAARWRAGDWWGSRAPAKLAKSLRKQHGG